MGTVEICVACCTVSFVMGAGVGVWLAYKFFDDLQR